MQYFVQYNVNSSKHFDAFKNCNHQRMNELTNKSTKGKTKTIYPSTYYVCQGYKYTGQAKLGTKDLARDFWTIVRWVLN